MKKVILFSFLVSSLAFSALKDGVFTAENKFDEKGWKTQVQITVNGGKVTDITVDDFNVDGERKSLNEAYNTRWKGRSQMDYPTAAPILTKNFLEKQNVEAIDTIVGATVLTDSFKKLTAITLKNSEAGNTTLTVAD